MQVVVAQDDSVRQGVVLHVHNVGESTMQGVVLTRLHLNGKDTTILHDKIHLALSLAVEIIHVESVGFQFLRHQILVDGAIVDGGIALQDTTLYVARILGSQETDVVLKQFEEVARARQEQGLLRFIDIIDGNGDTGSFQPQETVFVR